MGSTSDWHCNQVNINFLKKNCYGECKLCLYVLLLTLNISLFAANRPSSPVPIVDFYSDIAIREMERKQYPCEYHPGAGDHGVYVWHFGAGGEFQQSVLYLMQKKCCLWGPTYQLKDDDLDTEGKLIESWLCRAYNSPEESFIDHTDFLVNGTNYKPLFESTAPIMSVGHMASSNAVMRPILFMPNSSFPLSNAWRIYDARRAVVPDYIPAVNDDADMKLGIEEDDLRMSRFMKFL